MTLIHKSTLEALIIFKSLKGSWGQNHWELLPHGNLESLTTMGLGLSLPEKNIPKSSCLPQMTKWQNLRPQASPRIRRHKAVCLDYFSGPPGLQVVCVSEPTEGPAAPKLQTCPPTWAPRSLRPFPVAAEACGACWALSTDRDFANHG